ncbi:YihY/virulence factor BrkB family protein [Mariniblastus fucicola]|uniref:Uncharacterized protein n=1 Tax=Mariniblastus fucicola TaxID=980251 RepID=A0A5B9P5W9_9BACT|nr:YihY/virulence factor BrkB family protein [Mariniblastus fucicola]QEG20382.1 hypothetical protein MFFC18_02300 [Mariniblastus fucicola]
MFKKLINLIAVSAERFNENDGLSSSAAIAYYAAFSLPSILLISFSILGFFVEPTDVQGEIGLQVEDAIGEQAVEQLEEIVTSANQPKQNVFSTVVGGLMLLIGATGVLTQLQIALNKVWRVNHGDQRNPWLSMLLKRVLSLGMLLVMAFLLLVSISIRAIVSELGAQLDAVLPAVLSSGMLLVLNQVLSFVFLTTLLTAMFRFMPDVQVPWRSVWFGAFVTAVLFTLGKQLMGLYISYGNPGAVYGAAASLAIILAWVYYASSIVLFGAQLTQTWTTQDFERQR